MVGPLQPSDPSLETRKFCVRISTEQMDYDDDLTITMTTKRQGKRERGRAIKGDDEGELEEGQEDWDMNGTEAEQIGILMHAVLVRLFLPIFRGSVSRPAERVN